MNNMTNNYDQNLDPKDIYRLFGIEDVTKITIFYVPKLQCSTFFGFSFTKKKKKKLCY